MNSSLRLDNLRARLPRLKCDAVVVSDLTNVRYLAGFTGTSGMVIATKTGAWFLTDFRYKSQAAQQVPNEFKIVIAERGLWPEAAKLLKRAKVLRAGFEAEHTSVAALEEIEKKIKPVVAVSTKRVVEDLRLHKDDAEIEIIQRAVRVIDEVFSYICGVLKPGQVELEVADELHHQMKLRGAIGPSFGTIVASGVRGALPHGVASHKKLEAGDMVTIDMGAIVDGYCSDCTRTVCLGTPTRQQQKIYEIVWRAQTEACKQLRPGLGVKEADQIARKIIEDAGYGKQFGHGLGHGVGMQIHEPPRLSKLGKGKLAPGMIVTSEPGIYIENEMGVRIEDMLLITENGARILTKAAKPRKIIAL